jgi:hypothetical protein
MRRLVQRVVIEGEQALRSARMRVQAVADVLLERLILAIQGKGPFDGQIPSPRPRPPAVRPPEPRPPPARGSSRRPRPTGKRRQSGHVDGRRPTTHRSGCPH